MHKKRKRKTPVASNDHRSDFESDYDRVVFSAPFRRLQDKAQVFPPERNDFVRTRLTHSIEVATLARSLGVIVNEFNLCTLKTYTVSRKASKAA